MLTNIVELDLVDYICQYEAECKWIHRSDAGALRFSLLQQIEQLDQLTVLQTGQRMRLLGFVDERNHTWPLVEVPVGPDGQMVYTHTYDLRSYELNSAYKAAFPELMIPLDLGEGPRTFPILRRDRVDTLGAGAFHRWLKGLRFDLTSHLLGAKSKAVNWRVVDRVSPHTAINVSRLAMEHRQHINSLQGQNSIWSAYWTWAQETPHNLDWLLLAEVRNELFAVRPIAAAVKVVPGESVCNVDNVAFTLAHEFKPYSLALAGLAVATHETVFNQTCPRDLNLGTNLHGDFPYKDLLGELDHQPVWSMPLAPPGLSPGELLEHFKASGKVTA